ncbi:MAG: S1/P1 nuclease [Arenimonas sp.]
MRHRLFFPALAALAFLIGPGAAAAWGSKAHRVVANLAQDQLAPEAAAEVARLLAGEPDPSLVGIAYWADEQREAGTPLGRETAQWHYVNFADATCEYVPARDCPDGHCVVGEINRQLEILGNTGRTVAERAQALKFLVHLVGDVHQPLHAGRGSDWGGNKVQLSYRDEGWNLHSVWDRLLPARRGLDPAAHADLLRAHPQLAPDPTFRSDRRAVDWAVESCRIVESPGFYPAGHKLADAYLDAQLPVAELRLRQAGQRLADMLNYALARPKPVEPKR